jgi:hypothetical protein
MRRLSWLCEKRAREVGTQVRRSEAPEVALAAEARPLGEDAQGKDLALGKEGGTAGLARRSRRVRSAFHLSSTSTYNETKKEWRSIMEQLPKQRSDLEGGVVAIFTERLQRGQPILVNGTGEQRRDLLYVADVVDSLLTMAQSDRDGTWNVGTGISTSILELLRALEREIEPATEIRHGPRRPGDVNNSRLAIGSIENDLGWRPKYDLAGGIVDMIRHTGADR